MLFICNTTQIIVICQSAVMPLSSHRGFLRSDKPIGTALVKLDKLESQSEIREIVEVSGFQPPNVTQRSTDGVMEGFRRRPRRTPVNVRVLVSGDGRPEANGRARRSEGAPPGASKRSGRPDEHGALASDRPVTGNRKCSGYRYFYSFSVLNRCLNVSRRLFSHRQGSCLGAAERIKILKDKVSFFFLEISSFSP